MPSKPVKIKRRWVPNSLPTGIANRQRDPFYHTNRWRVESKQFLEENPLCAECKKTGMLTEAKITDHIIPKDICPDPWDRTNWRPLCKKCHSVKSAKDKQHFK